MRILQAPSNIANQPWSLAEGMRANGHDVKVWHYGPNPFGFPADKLVDFPAKNPMDLVRLVDKAIEEFDIFHFHFARSLIPNQAGWIPGLWDLPIIRAAGKKIFFTFHGSDIRSRTKHLELEKWSYFRFADVPCDEEEIEKRLDIIRAYAHGTYVCSPVNKPFVPDAGFHPRALIVDDWPFEGPSGRRKPLVVHIPSRRATKGTEAVVAGVAAAHEHGLDFEFRLLENLSHAEMKEALRECDVLVDNLLLGDYEVTGLEAMAMGKTVVARISDEVERTMGAVPVVSADPDTFVDVLEGLLADESSRDRRAKESRAFVEQHHDAALVAKNLVRDFLESERTIVTAFPGWASLGRGRQMENLEAQIRQLSAGARSRGKVIIVSGSRRGQLFTKIGTRLDRIVSLLARKVARLLKKR